MDASPTHCTACRICGAPEAAPWHLGGASAEFSFRYEPCRTPLTQPPSGTTIEHAGACRGSMPADVAADAPVSHPTANRPTARRERAGLERAG